MGSVTLEPIVTALQEAVTTSDIVTIFASGVKVALPLLVVWYGAKWVYHKFTNAVQGGNN